MPFADVNGIRLHYTDTGAPPGRPDAPALVMGHGLLFSGWMFHHQVDGLRDRYRCITVDWRGQGDTPAAGAADMDSLTTDLVALLDHLGLERVHYAGLSMGGFVGLRLAARHPERVQSLILLDTSAGPEDPDKVAQYRLLARVYRWLGIGAVRKKVEPIMFGPATLASSRRDDVVGPWVAKLRTVDRAGMRTAILGVTDRDPVVDELARIGAPTLVIVGADDVATPVAKAEAIVAGLGGARLEIVPDSGHSSTIEQPEAVTALFEAFLADQAG